VCGMLLRGREVVKTGAEVPWVRVWAVWLEGRGQYHEWQGARCPTAQPLPMIHTKLASTLDDANES
jgi:hypothetical protein